MKNLSTLRSSAFAAVILCALVTIGCFAAKLIYWQFPRIATSRLDSAFDLSSDQKRDARSKMDAALEWHRNTQIPGLILWMDKVQEIVSASTPIEHNDVRELVADLWEFRTAVYERIYGNSFWFFASLGQDQIAKFESHQAERNKDRFEDLEKGLDSYTKSRVASWQKRFEQWIGDLNATQLETLNLSASTAYEHDLKQRSQIMALQQEFLGMLRTLPETEPPDFVDQLWKITPSTQGTERFDMAVLVISDILGNMDAEQKSYLLNQIRLWRGRLQDLSGTPPAPSASVPTPAQGP